MEHEVIQVHHYPDADVVIRFKPEDPITEIPTTELPPGSHPAPRTYTLLLVLLVAMMLPLSALLFSVYVIFNPFTATVSILVSQQGALPLGRTLQPVTLSQSKTGPATGIGHENASTATGTVTFYNGLFTAQLIPQGTVFTGSDGVQVMTNADITVPAGNPPIYGQASVFAHALLSGISGNIAPGDINTVIGDGVLVKNLGPFYGGKNARSYHVVTQDDINALSTAVQTRLTGNFSSRFMEQLQPGEEMTTPQCHFQMSSNGAEGHEATQVTVKVSATCNASAYSTGRIKRYLSGRNTQEVLHLFQTYGQVAISFSGFGDDTRLPKENFIHLIFIVQEEQS